MNDEEIIRRVSPIFGSNAVHRRVREGYTDSFAIRLTGKKAAQVMLVVFPFLGIRRRSQVRSALEPHGYALPAELIASKQFAWLAGILEAEGSFGAGPPSKPNALYIKAEMVDRDVIARIC